MPRPKRICPAGEVSEDYDAFLRGLDTVWEADDHVSTFFRRLTVTHTTFPVQSNEHLLTVLRYVERNPVRAGLGRPCRTVALEFGLDALAGRAQRTGVAAAVVRSGTIRGPAASPRV